MRISHEQPSREATATAVVRTPLEKKIMLLTLSLSLLPICLILPPLSPQNNSLFLFSSSSSSTSLPPRRPLLGRDLEEVEDKTATKALKLATTAAQYHQKFAATRSFLSWSQNVGVSYSEYWHDKPCTTATTTFPYCAASQLNSSAAITNYSCGQRPPGRLHAAAVSYGYSHKTGGGTTITSYLLAFGGANGGILDDMWVFANGLVNGEYVSGTNRDIRDPASGFNTSCTDPSASSCSSCNRWHQVRARAVPRSATLCKLQPTACASTAAAGYVNATLDSFALTGHAATLISQDLVATAETQGSVLSFGGLRKGYGLSAETWYLNKLPFPTLGATASGYDALFPPTNSDVEWRCADIYGHCEDYPPEPNCAAQMESSSTTLTGPNGTIHSGRLLPITKCSWTIAPTHYYEAGNDTLQIFSRKLHAIIITVDKLELESIGRLQLREDQSESGQCESYMAVRETGRMPSSSQLLMRGCNKATLKASSYVSTTGQVSISIEYEKDCPHHAGMTLSYRVVSITSSALSCRGGCSGRGRCQAGKCVCDHGRIGARCERACRVFGECLLTEDSADIRTQVITENYPRPRQGHSLVSMFREASAKEIINSSVSVTEVLTQDVVSSSMLIQCRNDSLKLGCVLSLANCCVGSSVTSVESPPPHDLPKEFTHLGIFADRHITNITELFKCIQRDPQNELLCTKFEKMTVTVTTRTVSTTGTTRQILFGGWSGSRALNDIWVLDMMEPVAADLSTYLDCALPINSSGNEASSAESPIPRSYGMVGLEGVHFNRSEMKFTHVPCPNDLNPSRPTFPITARRSRWTQLAPTATSTTTINTTDQGATRVTSPDIVPGPRARFGHSAVLVKTDGEVSSRMVIFGGTNGLQTFNDIHSLIIPSNHHATTQGSKVVPLLWRNMTDVVDKDSGAWPPERAEHAASVFSGASGHTYMAIYGGRTDGTVLNDLWLFELDLMSAADQLQKKSRGWIHRGRGTEIIGTYLTSSLRFPLDVWPSLAQSIASLGFNYWATPAKSFPPRFGHIMATLETSAAVDSWEGEDHLGALATSQAMMIFSGSSATEVVSGKSHTRHGLIKGVDGGKDPMLFYVCPEANMACAQPVFQGS